MAIRLKVQNSGFESAFQSFLATRRQSEPDVSNIVSKILSEVQIRGDKALTE